MGRQNPNGFRKEGGGQGRKENRGNLGRGKASIRENVRVFLPKRAVPIFFLISSVNAERKILPGI